MPDAAVAGGLHLNLYPQRPLERRTGWDDAADGMKAVLATRTAFLIHRRCRREAARCDAMRAGIRDATDGDLIGAARRLRDELRAGPADHAAALAIVGEVARRTVGLDPHPGQTLGALALLGGRLVEMQTGEGKSLVAALAAAVAALSGTPVHIVTVNDYLAVRDAEVFAPLYRRLGLTVGAIAEGDDESARRGTYRADIVTVSNKALAFDHLRDRVGTGGQLDDVSLKVSALTGRGGPGRRQPVLRGLPFAIVDEADSVLIDEARIPLILSREVEGGADAAEAREAFALADLLTADIHYMVVPAERRVSLTEDGRALLAERVTHGPFANRLRREDAVRSALVARHLMQRGEQYVVKDGKVVIVDEYTGRLMPERSWSEGLQQYVEAKEDVRLTGRKTTLARTSYQRFFSRYMRLAGLTGTAREVRDEIARTYGLVTIRVAPDRPSGMRRHRARVHTGAEEKWAAVAARTGVLRAEGRPVLIGTRSVAASERASRALGEAGIPHTVLNAVNDREEAAIVARAGEAGQVTVATNMAGRGVHIALGEGVAARGGLHVILTERHSAGRIDRQLEGRTARQGEPGSTEAILALDDPLVVTARTPLLAPIARGRGFLAMVARRCLVRIAQRQAERMHYAARRALIRHDRRTDTMLAFGGPPE
ncbi:hypothetical protein DLJ53_16835 [Acuticoccus sediminis]|uniref:Protein translocase subunit SecA n=1 Tax=Acuticoccus sediminis TaxID=2184697 RepID=A0A8B2NTU5_9HYPH|nr:hypothetical protein [Acuticoccus sediminis]RAI00894.1 hypothetical protein DLJ53_16835 [Acuticoccus sediminis]